MARKFSKKVMDAADAYLALKAAQAKLAAQEVTLKNTLLTAGIVLPEQPLEIEGNVARVVISQCEGRDSIDMEKLRKLLTAKALASVIKTGAPSLRFGVKARVADAKVPEAA